jgi:DNA-directed RNA polymerase specialized sigma24 family protein
MSNDGMSCDLTPLTPRPAEGGIDVSGETAFLKRWDGDLVRAAKLAAARFGLHDSVADDLAQEARIRLLLLFRGRKSGFEGYIRRTISNSMRKALPRYTALANGCGLDLAEERGELEDGIESLHQHDLLANVTVVRWVGGLPTPLFVLYRLLYAGAVSQRTAATVMQVTQPRIAQLHRDLLARGRAALSRLAA